MKIFRITRTLTAAQLIAMRTTPVELIPAPGPGKVIVFEGAVLKHTAGATPFTGGGNITLNQGATANSATAAATVLTGGSSLTKIPPASTSIALVANTALSITNASDPFAAGNGTARIAVTFRIEEA